MGPGPAGGAKGKAPAPGSRWLRGAAGQRGRFLSLPGQGWARRALLRSRCLLYRGLCKGKQELPEREVSVPPRAAIWVLLWLRGQARARRASPGALGRGQFTLRRECCAGGLHPSPSACCRSWPPPTTPGGGRSPPGAIGHPRQGFSCSSSGRGLPPLPSPGAGAGGSSR